MYDVNEELEEYKHRYAKCVIDQTVSTVSLLDGLYCQFDVGVEPTNDKNFTENILRQVGSQISPMQLENAIVMLQSVQQAMANK